MDPKMIIVYCSPAGSTRRVAGILLERLRRRQVDAEEYDLANADGRDEALESIRASGNRLCLFVGSPVYRDLAVAPVMRFIDNLPETNGACAVPFVTWGAACSGLALWQMGRGLTRKGFYIAGAAKVLAAHSMMWQAQDRPGEGHPNNVDETEVNLLVDTLCRRFQSGSVPPLELDALDYQPPDRAAEVRGKMLAPGSTVPKKLDRQACTLCGVCEDECPVSAVLMSPFPEFQSACIGCCNCIRLCPEGAIQPAVSMDDIARMIRKRVQTIRERPLTQIFL